MRANIIAFIRWFYSLVELLLEEGALEQPAVTLFTGKRACFLSDKGFVYSLPVVSLLKTYMDMGSLPAKSRMPELFLGASWAHWILSGGKAMTKDEAEYLVEQLKDGVKAWHKVIEERSTAQQV